MKPAQDLARLQKALDTANLCIAWPEDRLYVKCEAISAWSPAQHLDHLARVLERVFKTLDVLEENTDPRILNLGHPHFVARMMLLSGWIPRGRGQSPDEVLPEPRPVRHRVRVALAELQQEAEGFVPRAQALLEAKGRLPYPLLGAFDASEWMRFAFIHTKHHLAIIAEIDQRRAVGALDDEKEAALRPKTAPGENGGCEAPAQSR